MILSYRQILSTFTMRFISLKKKMWHYSWVNFFQSYNCKYYKLDLVKNWTQVPSWLTHNVQLKSDNFSEKNLLNYCCLIIQFMKFLFEKTCVSFNRLSIFSFFKVQPEVCRVLNQRLFKKKIFTWSLNFIHWSWQLSSDLYIVSC